ncbi:MAG TPA: TadE/TadG family type IV pilus assembly protein [Baekduia sp.]|nr:TadE/TadG family type IV pilus assembly protein [Baekduia sp.]
MSWIRSKPRIERDADGEAGESMVEFALVLPVLLLVLVGVVQFALVQHAQNVVTTAAQEGARLAAAEGGEAVDGEQRTRDVLGSGLGGNSDDFEVVATDDGETVTVETSGDYPLIFPWLGSRDIELDATASVRKEGFRSGP